MERSHARIADGQAEPDETLRIPQDKLYLALRDLFPPEVAVAVRDPRLPHTGLLPEEESAIGGAVERRRREFAAGRAAARQAMDALGLPKRPIPMGRDRAPVWPEGVVGSISHSDAFCLAAVARSDRVLALGVDVEPDLPLEETLWDSVLTPDELAWLSARPAGERGRLARLIFSAKECVYKARYPLTRTLHGFTDMRVDLDLPAGAYRAVLLRDIGSSGRESWMGGFHSEGGVILTFLVLSRSG